MMLAIACQRRHHHIKHALLTNLIIAEAWVGSLYNGMVCRSVDDPHVWRARDLDLLLATWCLGLRTIHRKGCRWMINGNNLVVTLNYLAREDSGRGRGVLWAAVQFLRLTLQLDRSSDGLQVREALRSPQYGSVH